MTTHWIDSLLLGESAAMQRLKTLILRTGPTALPVLIEGPTGSGKELVAQALHVSSGRRGKFVAFNVCAIPESVFESALFGHMRGAFTGATSDLPGYLVEAHDGTAFFDEIGGLPLPLQPKLLRAIETRVFRPVGARADQRSDFRIIAATNDHAIGLLAAGRLREDLFERLAAVVISIPPLRDRVDDIPLLADHFLDGCVAPSQGRARLTSAAVHALQERDWPRNVRQLRNTIARAVAIASNATIGREEIAAALEQVSTASTVVPDSFERRRLLSVLEESEWNVPNAAIRLGIDRATLYRRLKRHGIEVSAARTSARNESMLGSAKAARRATSHPVAATGCDSTTASDMEVLR